MLSNVHVDTRLIKPPRLHSRSYGRKPYSPQAKYTSRLDHAMFRGGSNKIEFTQSTSTPKFCIRKMSTQLSERLSECREMYIQRLSTDLVSAFQGGPGPMLSSRHMRSMMKNLFEQQYSSAAPLDLSNPAQLFLDLPGVKFKSASCNKNKHKHTVAIEVILDDGNEMTGSCHDTKKLDATMGAYLHLLLQLHGKGVLEQILVASNKLRSRKAAAFEDRQSIVDVYNYCAVFKAVPRVTATPLKGECSPWGFRVRIMLEEQSIHVIGIGESFDHALQWAAFLFKQEAEMARRQIAKTSPPLMPGPLTISSAKAFLGYCRQRCPNNMLKIISRQSPCKCYWEARPFYNLTPVGEPSFAANKRTVEKLATLVLGVFMIKHYPSLLTGFESALSSTGSLIRDLDPVAFSLPRKTIQSIEKSLILLHSSGFSPHVDSLPTQDHVIYQTPRIVQRISSDPAMIAKSTHLQSKFDQYLTSEDPDIVRIRAQRALLPISKFRDQVERHINGNAFSIIVGAPGSGKTTQVPQILLEEASSRGRGVDCNVVCTQPRRIAAMSVAQRVANERGEQLGHCAGYHVRGNAKLPNAGGSITYCTTGILLKQLQLAPNSALDNISHIVIDEAHERDTLVDFIMAVLKSLLSARRRESKSVPKVTIMSATIDVDRFASYFEEKQEDGTTLKCPSLNIPGKAFHVQETYLDEILDTLRHEDQAILEQDRDTNAFLEAEKRFSANLDVLREQKASISWKTIRTFTPDGQLVSEQEEALVPINLVIATVAHVARRTSSGAILVFLPGIDDIKAVRDGLFKLDFAAKNLNTPLKDTSRFRVCLLHSTIPVEEQHVVFETPSLHHRRIILATNIAETSLTIPDVQHVVDTGKLREKRYDPVTGINRLHCTWISASSAQQRAGRAGRVSKGTYHGLYSFARRRNLQKNGSAEIVRSDIQNVCLDVKAQAISVPIREFLAQTIEPPPAPVVDAAVRSLQDMAALNAEEEVTPLGRLLSTLPVHPRLGKMIVFGVMFKCLDPITILAAAMNEPSIFSSPVDKRREAMLSHQTFLGHSNSDHIATIQAYQTLRRMHLYDSRENFDSYVATKFLHKGVFYAIMRTTKEIEIMLREAGLVSPSRSQQNFEGEIGNHDLNRHSNQVSLIKAIILGGLAPNLAVAVSARTLRTRTESNVQMHRSSLNHIQPKNRLSDVFPRQSIFSFSSLNKNTSKNTLSLRDSTLVTPLSAILFGGKLSTSSNTIQLDKWLTLYLDHPTRATQIIAAFRNSLDKVLMSYYYDLDNFRTSQKSDRAVMDTKRPSGTSQESDEAREAFIASIVDVLGMDDSGDLIARAHAMRKEEAKLYQ